MKLQALDLAASYGIGGAGVHAKQLIDTSGAARFSHSLWETGRKAVEILGSELEGNENYQGVHHLAEFLPLFVRSGEEFLDEEFSTTVAELLECGKIELAIDPLQLDQEPKSLSDVWAEYEFPDKVELYCRIFDGLLPHFQEAQPIVTTLQRLSATAILIWLDDALIADFLDGRGLDPLISGVEKLRPHLDRSKDKFAMFDSIRRQARQENARAGAKASHAEHRAIRQDVYKWLDANMARFRSMDEAASAIAGKVAPIAWRTARDWVGEWKKVRAAGKA